MAHRAPVSINQVPVNIVENESVGTNLVAQVTGSEPVILYNGAAAGEGGFSYQPGAFIGIRVVNGEGVWAHCRQGTSTLSWSDG